MVSSMSFLAVLWFFLIFVLIAVYFVLDGFDLGVGLRCAVSVILWSEA